MKFGQWYVSRGRISRRTFWLHYLVPLLVLDVLAVLADMALGNVDVSASTTSTSASAAFQLGWVSAVVSLLTIVPAVSSQVTRLHDRGHSAWWLLFDLIPIIGWIVILVQTWFLSGEPRTNQYGAPVDGRQPMAEPAYPKAYS